jgi:hypothetical protein
MCKNSASEGVVIGELLYRQATVKDREDIIEAFFTYMLQGKTGNFCEELFRDYKPRIIN